MDPILVYVYSSETIAPGVTVPLCQSIIASYFCTVYSASTAMEDSAIL